jgi:hypothetical protein
MDYTRNNWQLQQQPQYNYFNYNQPPVYDYQNYLYNNYYLDNNYNNKNNESFHSYTRNIRKYYKNDSRKGTTLRIFINKKIFFDE